MIKRILKNQAIIFVILKYIAFGIQLINSLLIAKFLGFHYFGLYGFALMILQYLSYTNFGVYYSYSVMCADVSTKTGEQRIHITGSAITVLSISCLLLFIVYLGSYGFDLFPKYNFSEYSLWVVIIAVLQHFNNLFINIFRIHGKIGEINFYYLIVPLLQLIAVLFFRETALFYALLYANAGGSLLSLIFFFKGFPEELKKIRIPDFSMARIVIERGVWLLLYNLTFYGIILTARTIVSKFFSVEEFALFNFANSISNNVFLLLGTLNFLFYPKLINMISLKSDEQVIVFIEKIRKYYLTLTVLIVFISLLSLTILFYFLPQYTEAMRCLQILLLAQLIINNSYGYSTLMVQRGKELQMTFIAVITIVIIVIISLISLHFFKEINTVAIAVVLGVLLYNILVSYKGLQIINQYTSLADFLKRVFSITLFLPIICCIALFVINCNYYVSIIASMLFYLLLNIKELRHIMVGGLKILSVSVEITPNLDKESINE
ncbi:lipopolysaccharide biosynthesis protein [Leadbetterella sp. DM7]|uniref:lipopolysaccharide biosynthesis protein n=1 Tax=Leadbetterella sp. DM7 TaxID=3235085 RepID=UPI00349EE383